MKILLSLLSLFLAGKISAQIHNDLCKEGAYPQAPYALNNNTIGANLQPGEESPGAGNTHWNVVVTKPLRQITVAVTPNYCVSSNTIKGATIRVYDDVVEQHLNIYYNECPKPQPTLGPSTQKLKYEGQKFGNSASVFFNMPAFGGIEPNGNTYYDIQIDGAMPGNYNIAVVQEDQYQKVGNDFICDAQQLKDNQAISGTNCLATALFDEPIGATWKDSLAENTHWYYFDATSAGSVVELSTTNFDGQLAVYDRGIASQAFCSVGGQAHTLINLLASADCYSGNKTETVYVPTIAGNRYKVQVDGNKSAGNYAVKWLNRDIAHPADQTVSSGDSIILKQNYLGSYSTIETLPAGVVAYQQQFGNDTLFVVSNSTLVNQIIPVYFSLGCQVVDTILVTIKAKNGNGISDQNKVNEKSITIFPNPSTGLIEFNTKKNFTSISLSDSQGKLLVSSPFVQSMNLTHLAKGVYFIQIKSSSETYNEKLILE